MFQFRWNNFHFDDLISINIFIPESVYDFESLKENVKTDIWLYSLSFP